jgi:hypothetical protein
MRELVIRRLSRRIRWSKSSIPYAVAYSNVTVRVVGSSLALAPIVNGDGRQQTPRKNCTHVTVAKVPPGFAITRSVALAGVDNRPGGAGHRNRISQTLRVFAVHCWLLGWKDTELSFTEMDF